MRPILAHARAASRKQLEDFYCYLVQETQRFEGIDVVELTFSSECYLRSYHERMFLLEVIARHRGIELSPELYDSSVTYPRPRLDRVAAEERKSARAEKPRAKRPRAEQLRAEQLRAEQQRAEQPRADQQQA